MININADVVVYIIKAALDRFDEISIFMLDRVNNNAELNFIIDVSGKIVSISLMLNNQPKSIIILISSIIIVTKI